MTSAKTTFLAGSLTSLFLACGGAGKLHSGYPEGDKEPWTSPIKLKLNNNFEASSEGNVSFPKRARAKWYVVELPGAGSLIAKLKMEALSTGADVGIEILDSGFNINVPAIDDNDIGQDEKYRKVKEARSGRTYIHVYALNRTDEADYRLRLRFEPKEVTTSTTVVNEEPSDPRTNFPWTVPNLPPLPAVPPTDDAPRKGRAPRPDAPEPEPVVVEADPAEGAKVRAHIIEFSKSGSQVKILINKGSDAGVEQGWTGYVVDKKGKSLPKGAFKIKKAKSDESEGTVSLTLDEIQANRAVVLKPPQ